MRSGFFNSNITGNDEQGQPIFDRAEDATFFARYFSQIVGNGVFAQPGTGLMVQAKEDMTVTVQAGTCFINGYMGWLENDQPLSIAAASTVYDRIDRIVARYDALQRNIDVYLVQGQASAVPVAPELVRDGDKYELALADVYVARNATALRQADITDLRLNESVCGIVASPIEHLETEQVTAQLTDTFDQWFEKMKGQLTEDAAGHLQEQVDVLSRETKTHTEDLSNPHQVTAEQIGAAGKAYVDMQLAGKADTAVPNMISLTEVLKSNYEPYLDYAATYCINELGQVGIWATIRKTNGNFSGSEIIGCMPEGARPRDGVHFVVVFYVAFVGGNDNTGFATGVVRDNGDIVIYFPTNTNFNVVTFHVIYNIKSM